MEENNDWLDALLRQPMPERRNDDFVASVMRRVQPNLGRTGGTIRFLVLFGAVLVGLIAMFQGLSAADVVNFGSEFVAAVGSSNLVGANGLTVIFAILLSVALPLVIAVDDRRST